MNKIYLFKMSTIFNEKIEFIVSAKSVEGSIMFVKRELKKELIPLKKQAKNSLKKEIKLIIDMGINYRKKFKEEKDENLLKVLDEYKLFGGIGNMPKYSYNEYMSNKKQFRIDYLEEYYKYYYQKDYSFEFNLKNGDFEIINLTKVSKSSSKNKIFSETIVINKL